VNPFKGTGEPLGLNHEGIQDSHRHSADPLSLPGRRGRAALGLMSVVASVVVSVVQGMVVGMVVGVVVGVPPCWA